MFFTTKLFILLNWIVWNRNTDYWHKIDLALNKLQRMICHKTQPTHFCANFLFLHIMLLIFLSLSPHNIIIIIITSFRIFYANVSWQFLPRGLGDIFTHQISSVLLSILADLKNAVVLMIPILIFQLLHVLVPILWWLNQEHPLQLVSSSHSCSMVCFFLNSLAWSKYWWLFSLFFFPILLVCQPGKQNSLFCKFFFCSCRLLLGLVVWPRLHALLASQNPREVLASHSPGQILGCEYIFCMVKI